MTDKPEGPGPVRRVAAIDRELLIVEGQRIARTSRTYVNAATGEPLGTRTTDTAMPPGCTVPIIYSFRDDDITG